MIKNIILVVVAMLALAACGRQGYEHYINVVEVDGSGRASFEFGAEGFSRSYIWVDIYEYGELANTMQMGSTSDLSWGTLWILFRDDGCPDYMHWTFTHSIGARTSIISMDSEDLPRPDFHGWGFWHMTGSMPAPIRDGEVIDLAHLELILSERQWQPNAETSVTAPVLPATFRYVARIKFVK